MGIKDTDEYKNKMKQFARQEVFLGVVSLIAFFVGLPLLIIGGINCYLEDGLSFGLTIGFIIGGASLIALAGVSWAVIFGIQKPYKDKIAIEEEKELEQERKTEQEDLVKKNKTNSNRRLKTYVTKRDLVINKYEDFGDYFIKTYIPKDEFKIGCVAIFDKEGNLTILEHNFITEPLFSLSKYNHFESHVTTVQSHSIYNSNGDYLPVYGTKEIGHDKTEYSASLFVTDSKGKVNVFNFHNYYDSYELTALKCRGIGFKLSYEEKRY